MWESEYQSTPMNFTEIVHRWKQKITNAIVTIDEAILQQRRQEVEYRHNVFRVINAAYLEVY